MMDLYTNNIEEFNVQYLSNCKEAAQFMSCFLSLYLLYIDKNPYTCRHLPVLFDASCSGMQHLSALTSNLDLATYVNVISNDSPEDFYSTCAKAVEETASLSTIDDLKDVCSYIRIDRSLIKKCVMTIPYNIGLEGVTEQITDKFLKVLVEQQPPVIDKYGKNKKNLFYIIPSELTLKNESVKITGRQAGLLGSLIYRTVLTFISPVNDLREYFKSVMKIFKLLGKPIF